MPSKTASQTKRSRSSFWDPDSDTEYGRVEDFRRLRRLDPHAPLPASLSHTAELDEDVVIVSRINLGAHVPPVEYAKSHYDANMNAFDAQLKQLAAAGSPQGGGLGKRVFTVTAKTPLSSSLVAAAAAAAAAVACSSSSQESLAAASVCSSNSTASSQQSRQRRAAAELVKYVHHVSTNNAPVAKFEVDALRQYAAVAAATTAEKIEIYAAGFRCIARQAGFEKSDRFLRRRSRSFGGAGLLNSTAASSRCAVEAEQHKGLATSARSMLNLNFTPAGDQLQAQQQSQNKNKISLNDYVSTRQRQQQQQQQQQSVSEEDRRTGISQNSLVCILFNRAAI